MKTALRQSTLADFAEKDFISSRLAPFAATARPEDFDDCVVIDLPSLDGEDTGYYLVYSLDHPSKIKTTHPPDLEHRFYGRWIAGCVCGDVLAMGAASKGFSLDLGLPLDTPTHHVEDLYRGITDVLDVYGARFEGGNLDIGAQLETVGMAWGVVRKDRIVRRSGAGAGDVVVVTALPGVGWASYLARKRGLWEALPDALRKYLRDPLMPVAPFRALQRVQNEQPGAFTSGMDLTDGLTEFLHTVAKTPGLGVRVDETRLPTSPELASAAEMLGLPASALAFDPGYDTPRIHGYTVAAEKLEAVKGVFAAEGAPLYPVARVVAGSGVALTRADGALLDIPWFCDDQFAKEGVVERWTRFAEELLGS